MTRALAIQYLVAELAALNWDDDACKKHASECEAVLWSAVNAHGGYFTDKSDGLTVISHEAAFGGGELPRRFLRFERVTGALTEAHRELPRHYPTWRRGIDLAIASARPKAATARGSK